LSEASFTQSMLSLQSSNNSISPSESFSDTTSLPIYRVASYQDLSFVPDNACSPPGVYRQGNYQHRNFST
jgi:hypothetical protein